MEIRKYFPAFTPKAITFSIDDGNIKHDKIFIDIVRPAGIKGTFNLYFGNKRELTSEEYRALYRGFEIANHCNRHPFAFNKDKEYTFADELFDPNTADESLVYKTEREGVYRIRHRNYWATIATTEAYLELAEEGRRDIEEIFGKGSVKCFVWPYGKQNDEELYRLLKTCGYSSVRRAYSTGYSIPEDLFDWGVNADSTDFDSKIREFEALSDDGELKFFCLGLHSVDFERNNKWNELRAFAENYGNRPCDYWYASVSEIFEYSEAINSIKFNGEELVNPSDKELYLTVNGQKYILPPNSKTHLKA